MNLPIEYVAIDLLMPVAAVTGTEPFLALTPKPLLTKENTRSEGTCGYPSLVRTPQSNPPFIGVRRPSSLRESKLVSCGMGGFTPR